MQKNLEKKMRLKTLNSLSKILSMTAASGQESEKEEISRRTSWARILDTFARKPRKKFFWSDGAPSGSHACTP